jgi:drug/metabolite transporter (DMT)-like permease
MIFECLVVSCIFGLAPVIDKHIAQFISEESIIIIFGVFYFVYALILMNIYHKEVRRDVGILNNNLYLYALIFVSTILIFLVANYLYLGVLKNNNTYVGVALTSIYPLITLIAGYVFLNERFTYTHLAGLFVIVLGVLLLGHT